MVQGASPPGPLTRPHTTVPAVTEATLGSSSSAAAEPEVEDNWVPICRPEDLPKGEAALHPVVCCHPLPPTTVNVGL